MRSGLPVCSIESTVIIKGFLKQEATQMQKTGITLFYSGNAMGHLLVGLQKRPRLVPLNGDRKNGVAAGMRFFL
jgi:hypothetical protein